MIALQKCFTCRPAVSADRQTKAQRPFYNARRRTAAARSGRCSSGGSDISLSPSPCCSRWQSRRIPCSAWSDLARWSVPGAWWNCRAVCGSRLCAATLLCATAPAPTDGLCSWLWRNSSSAACSQSVKNLSQLKTFQVTQGAIKSVLPAGRTANCASPLPELPPPPWNTSRCWLASRKWRIRATEACCKRTSESHSRLLPSGQLLRRTTSGWHPGWAASWRSCPLPARNRNACREASSPFDSSCTTAPGFVFSKRKLSENRENLCEFGFNAIQGELTLSCCTVRLLAARKAGAMGLFNPLLSKFLNMFELLFMFSNEARWSHRTELIELNIDEMMWRRLMNLIEKLFDANSSKN